MDHGEEYRIRKWVEMATIEYLEHFEIVQGFECREHLRQDWAELTEEQRAAITEADAWAEANVDRLLPSLTLPGNKLPPEHYARRYAADADNGGPSCP